MKSSTTASRLKEIMGARNLRQVDILNAAKPYCERYGVKLGRNDLSQYVSGKVEPGQEKLTILGHALNVSEAWLMGYDVSPSRETGYSTDEQIDLYIRGIKKWSTDFRLSDDQRYRLKEYLADLFARTKEYVNQIAESSQLETGKILKTPALQQAEKNLLLWVANGLGYINNEYSDDPFDENGIREQYLSAISQLSRRDQIAWLIRIQDFIEQNDSAKEEQP